MRKRICVVVVMVLCSVMLAGAVTADSPSKAASKATKPPPGVEAAQAISTITGVAISPLLGVGAVGAWKYIKTPGDKRANLPWFAQPWFWVPALALVLMVFVKDALGPAVPTTLKKPFDVAELIENKISALVATGAFVPFIAAIFHSLDETAWLSSAGFAGIDASPLFNLLAVPIAMAAFVVVWLAGHVINVLILVSPFATVDAALKSFRLFLVSTVALTSFANPYFGAVWALIIILFSYLIAGWSLRLSVFGSVFAWDLLTFRRLRFEPNAQTNWMFTARKMGNTPIRTYGKLSRDQEGKLVLTYRPWLILPERTLVLPEGPCFVGRGLFHPEIRGTEAGEEVSLLTLPPRYRKHEEQVAQIYGLGEVQDIGLRRGFKALWRWLKSLFGFKPKPIPAAA